MASSEDRWPHSGEQGLPAYSLSRAESQQCCRASGRSLVRDKVPRGVEPMGFGAGSKDRDTPRSDPAHIHPFREEPVAPTRLVPVVLTLALPQLPPVLNTHTPDLPWAQEGKRGRRGEA